MKYDNLEPIWLWRLKVETTRPGKEKKVKKIAPNGQIVEVPEVETIKMKSELCFDIREVIEYHELIDQKGRTIVLLKNVGALNVLWNFNDFDAEYRRRIKAIETSKTIEAITSQGLS